MSLQTTDRKLTEVTVQTRRGAIPVLVICTWFIGTDFNVILPNNLKYSSVQRSLTFARDTYV